MVTSILYIIAFWVIYFLALTFAWYISEELTRPFGVFDILPFHCRKCCTFWTMLLSYISFSIPFYNIYFLSCGIAITIATTVCIIITERERMTDEEEDRDFFIE